MPGSSIAVKKALRFCYQHLFLFFSVIALIFSLLAVFISIATDTIPRGIFYNSDSLYIPMFYKDLFSGYSLWGWIHPPASYFFPDIALYSLINFALGSFYLVIMGFGLVQSLLFIASLLLLSSLVFGRHKGLYALILTVSSLFFLTLATGKCEPFLPIIQNGYHFGAFLIGMFSLSLVLKIIENERNSPSMLWWTLCLGSLTTFTFMSDAIYAVQIVLPIGSAIFFLFLLSRISLRSLSYLYFALFPSLFLGSCLNYFLLIYRIPQDTGAVLTFDKILENLAKAGHDLVHWDDCVPEYLPFFHTIWAAYVLLSLGFLGVLTYKALRYNARTTSFSAINWASLFWFTGLFLVSGHLFFRWSFRTMGPLSVAIGLLLIWRVRPHSSATVKSSFEDLNPKLLFILAFFVCCLFFNIGSVAILGKAVPRRLVPSLLIPVFFGWPFLLAGSQRLRSYLASTHLMNLFTIGILGLIFTLSDNSVLQNLSVLSKLSDFYPDFVACIDEYTRKYHVKNGLSQYWYARKITMLSKNDLNVVQVRHGERSPLVPDHWINNYNWYNQKFEFLITEVVPDSPWNIYPQAMMKYFGSPEHVFVCHEKAVLVYNGEQDQRFQEQFKNLFFIELPASELPSETGNIEGTSRIAQSPNDQPGALTYGPYVYLHIGTYRFEIHVDAQTERRDKSVGKWEIVVYPEETFEQGAEHAQVIQKGEIANNGPHVISGTFKIRNYNRKVEIRTSYKGEGFLKVEKLLIRRIR